MRGDPLKHPSDTKRKCWWLDWRKQTSNCSNGNIKKFLTLEANIISIKPSVKSQDFTNHRNQF